MHAYHCVVWEFMQWRPTGQITQCLHYNIAHCSNSSPGYRMQNECCTTVSKIPYRYPIGGVSRSNHKISYAMAGLGCSRFTHGQCIFHFARGTVFWTPVPVLKESSTTVTGKIPKPYHSSIVTWFKVTGHMHNEVLGQRTQRQDFSRLHTYGSCCCEAMPSQGEVAPTIGRGGNENHQEILRIVSDAVHDEGTFVEVSLRGKAGPSQPWRQLVVRPVLLREKRQLQVVVIVIGRFSFD